MSLAASLAPLPRGLLAHDIAHLRDLLLHQLHLRLVSHAFLLRLPLQVGHLGGKGWLLLKGRWWGRGRQGARGRGMQGGGRTLKGGRRAVIGVVGVVPRGQLGVIQALELLTCSK